MSKIVDYDVRALKKKIEESIDKEEDVTSLVDKLEELENKKIEASMPKDFVKNIKHKVDNDRRMKKMKFIKVAIASIAVLSVATISVNAATGGKVMDKIRVIVNGEETNNQDYVDKNGNIKINLKDGETYEVETIGDPNDDEKNYAIQSESEADTKDSEKYPYLNTDNNKVIIENINGGSMDITEQMKSNNEFTTEANIEGESHEVEVIKNDINTYNIIIR